MHCYDGQKIESRFVYLSATGWCDDSGPARGLELKVTDNAISLEQGCRLLKALNLTQITASGSSSGKTMNEEDLISEHQNTIRQTDFPNKICWATISKKRSSLH